MARAKFTADLNGYRELLGSSEIQSILDDVAERIADRASSMLSEDWGGPPREDHFTVGTTTNLRFAPKGRLVYTHTEHAKRSQAKHKTLTKAANSVSME